MSESESADGSPLPPRRERPIYLLGLRQFLLASMAAGIWISLWILQPQIEPLRESVSAMRLQAGRLVIEDPSKIYVLEQAVLEDRRFRFRVFIPNSPSFSLCLRTRDIDSALFDQPPRTRTPLSPGEHTVEVMVSKMPDKTQSIALVVDDKTMQTVNESEPWETQSASWNSAGKSSQVAFEPEQNHQLLRYRFNQVQADGSSTTPSGPVNGLLLWISASEK